MIVSSQLRRDFIAWSNNPTPRTHARLVASLARMDTEMYRRGMKDVYHKDAKVSCPRELRAILEFYKVWEGHEFSAA